MKMTPAEVSKYLKKLAEEKARLEDIECRSRVFNAAMGEDIESVRPEYNYAEMQRALDELDLRVIAVKHALNKFNLETVVPETGLTVDQVLVRIPQLTKTKQKLMDMSTTLPKERVNIINFGRSSTIIDYTYANYDVDAAKKDLEDVTNQLYKLQSALDLVNSTYTIEIE